MNDYSSSRIRRMVLGDNVELEDLFSDGKFSVGELEVKIISNNDSPTLSLPGTKLLMKHILKHSEWGRRVEEMEKDDYSTQLAEFWVLIYEAGPKELSKLLRLYKRNTGVEIKKHDLIYRIRNISALRIVASTGSREWNIRLFLGFQVKMNDRLFESLEIKLKREAMRVIFAR